MNIALIICIPITALVVGFLILKAVQLGLKWNVQMKQDKEPELRTVVDDIKDHAQEKKAEKQAEITQSIFDEWTNGAKE
jgi:Mg2+/Co2+ transporter CorB